MAPNAKPRYEKGGPTSRPQAASWTPSRKPPPVVGDLCTLPKPHKRTIHPTTPKGGGESYKICQNPVSHGEYGGSLNNSQDPCGKLISAQDLYEYAIVCHTHYTGPAT